MEIIKTNIGSILVLSLKGRIDSDTSPVFEKEVLEVIDQGNVRLVADCSELEYISSSGLRVFLLALKAVRPLSGEIAVCSLKDHVKEVFDIVGFIGLFAIFDTAENAVKKLSEMDD